MSPFGDNANDVVVSLAAKMDASPEGWRLGDSVWVMGDRVCEIENGGTVVASDL